MDLIEKYHFYINLKMRENRNKECIDTLKSLGISSPNRFNAIMHNNGYIGCVKSHIKCIELAKKKGYPFVCIFEDDIVIRNIDKCRELINKYIEYDYDVLYLGCDITDNNYEFITDELIHVRNAECNHAYIIKSHYYDKILKNYNDGLNNKNDNPNNPSYNMDKYLNILQNSDKWYSLYPIFISQKDGYSDITKKDLVQCAELFNIPTHNSNLPYVSLLTPTFNRKRFLELMISNIRHFKYPKEKIEWNILESNDKELNNYNDKLLDDELKTKLERLLGIKIKYVYIDKKLTLGEKRNMLCESSSHDYLINMDDDDIYLPGYINYSIDILLNHNKDITSCLDMLFIYPMKDFKTSYIKCVKDYKLYHEAPLCMKKSHWEKHKYSIIKTGEGKTVYGDESVCGISNVTNCMICVCWDENTVNKDIFLQYPVDLTISGESMNILKNIFNKYREEIKKNIENINKKIEDKKIEDITINEIKDDKIIIQKSLLQDIRKLIEKASPQMKWQVEELLSVGLMIKQIDELLS
jgi:GR25 family glycosyltransferase involved in LPS biosynthesis